MKVQRYFIGFDTSHSLSSSGRFKLIRGQSTARSKRWTALGSWIGCLKPSIRMPKRSLFLLCLRFFLAFKLIPC